MLVNPGGPGAPGRSLAGATATRLSPQVAADYDIVGFDPRGVGGSVPGAELRPDYFFRACQPDYIPANAAAEQVLINRAKTYAAGLRAAVRLAAALRDEREHGARHGPDPPGVRRAEDHLLRVLLRHLPGPGLRHAVPRAGSAGWCSTRTVDPTGAWYAGQHQPGLRLPGPDRRVLRLDREIRLRLPPGQHGRRRCEAPTTGSRDQLAKPGHRARAGRRSARTNYDDTFIIGGYLNTMWPALRRRCRST